VGTGSFFDDSEKAHYIFVDATNAELLGRMMVLAPKLALQEGCRPYPEGGFRIVSNTGAEGGQEVHHMHWHVMGGPRPWLRG
jgi:histidine triad (HIT) family protein